MSFSPGRFFRRATLGTAFTGLFLSTSAALRAAEQTPPVTARTYWESVEQRPGQVETLFLRLEATQVPEGTLQARLILPEGVRIAPENNHWWSSLWSRISGFLPAYGLQKEIRETDWKRGEVVTNSVKTYFSYRIVPETHPNATVSWNVLAARNVDAEGEVEISGQNIAPIRIPVKWDFRTGPQIPVAGTIPPPVPAKHDYLVGALYYPGWVPGRGSGWNLLEPFPERKPALGYHDASSPAVSDWEIKWALENGINFFALCWYAPFGKGEIKAKDLFLGQTLHEGLLKSHFLDRFHFALLWENSVGEAVSRERLMNDFLPFWITNYFKNPSYLVVDGKPVLFVYDVKKFVANQGGVEEAARSVSLMRQALVNAGFQGLWLAGEYRGTDPARFKEMADIGFDAAFPYCYGLSKPKNNREAVEEIMDLARRQDRSSGIPVIATASVSWDPQPWIEYIDYPWNPISFWLDPAHFKDCVERMKKRIDGRPAGNPLAKRMLLIDNWNEYAEGHWVAPSRKEGFRYLNAIRDVFAPQAAGQPDTMLEDAGMAPEESAYKSWLEKMKKTLPHPTGATSPQPAVPGTAESKTPAFDYGKDPVRYLENGRLKLGINLGAGGAATFLEDKACHSGNMINSYDWGRQIQLSYYGGPIPFVGPNGETPDPRWASLGWNPIQAGSMSRIPSKTIAFEQGKDFLRVRCVPMQWPHKNVPGDCIFEATYRIVADNVLLLEARIINARQDKKQYLPVRDQEMPALYTNGAWYRLVTYLGDAPFTDGPLTTIVDKGDGKGWPWSKFYSPEHWAALVDKDGRGVGLYQEDTAQMVGGFAGADSQKGGGSPTDDQTAYLSPIAKRILDANIDWTYRTYIILGSVEEIRSFAEHRPRLAPVWNFAADRHGWSYENAHDSGWPVRDGLDIAFGKSGSMFSDVMFWKAQDAPVLEIEAAFGKGSGTGTLTADAVIQPFGREDQTDFPAWIEPRIKAASEKKHEDFPAAAPLHIPFEVQADGVMRVYRIPLSGQPGYTGAMKQLRLQFPAMDGTVRIRRIALVP